MAGHGALLTALLFGTRLAVRAATKYPADMVAMDIAFMPLMRKPLPALTLPFTQPSFTDCLKTP
jgi:hypothetical protein